MNKNFNFQGFHTFNRQKWQSNSVSLLTHFHKSEKSRNKMLFKPMPEVLFFCTIAVCTVVNVDCTTGCTNHGFASSFASGWRGSVWFGEESGSSVFIWQFNNLINRIDIYHRNHNTVIVIYINTIKTTLDITFFYFYQAFQQQRYTLTKI